MEDIVYDNNNNDNNKLRMVYSLPNNQRMPHVVIDASSKGSLATIASLPSSRRKY